MAAWVVWGLAVSGVLFASELLPAVLTVNTLGREGYGVIMYASGLADFVWLMVLPFFLLYLVARGRRADSPVLD